MKGPQIGDLAIPDRHLLAAAGDKRYTDCAGPYLLCRKQRLQMQMEPWRRREPSEGSGVWSFAQDWTRGGSGQTSYQVWQGETGERQSSTHVLFHPGRFRSIPPCSGSSIPPSARVVQVCHAMPPLPNKGRDLPSQQLGGVRAYPTTAQGNSFTAPAPYRSLQPRAGSLLCPVCEKTMRDVKIVLRLKSERFISIFFNSAPLQLLLAIALLLLLDLPDSNLSDPCHAIKVRSGVGAIISFSDSKGQSSSRSRVSLCTCMARPPCPWIQSRHRDNATVGPISAPRLII